MRHIEIEPTYITPQVILNPIDGKCLFKGNSILFDVDQFYIPLTNWFDKFVAQKHQPKIEVVFELDNCNVLSIEKIAIILQRLEFYRNDGGEVLIKWHYHKSDEDNLEIGEDFSEMLSLPFQYAAHESRPLFF